MNVQNNLNLNSINFSPISEDVQIFRGCSQAAQKGHVVAMGLLGEMYRLGLGVESDATLAFHWTKQAADNDSVVAMFSLAFMYNNGLGVVKNDIEEIINPSLEAVIKRGLYNLINEGTLNTNQDALNLCGENNRAITLDTTCDVLELRDLLILIKKGLNVLPVAWHPILTLRLSEKPWEEAQAALDSGLNTASNLVLMQALDVLITQSAFEINRNLANNNATEEAAEIISWGEALRLRT